jgi:hypothetical protein
MKTKILAITLVLQVFAACALGQTVAATQAPTTLSGSYTGFVQFLQADGIHSYRDETATLAVVQLDEGGGTGAVITYGDKSARYQETCSVKANPDGSLTLQGISYKTLFGTNPFNLDTFKIEINKDGSITGSSADQAGEGTLIQFHR